LNLETVIYSVKKFRLLSALLAITNKFWHLSSNCTAYKPSAGVVPFDFILKLPLDINSSVLLESCMLIWLHNLHDNKL